MARLIVLLRPLRPLDVVEMEDWLRRELIPITSAAEVRSATLGRLASASPRSTQDRGWLVELEFETAELARGAVRESAWAILIGDLRLLGMSPTVAFVDSVETLGV